MLSNLENNISNMGIIRIISVILNFLVAATGLVFTIIWGGVMSIVLMACYLAADIGVTLYYLFAEKAEEALDPTAIKMIISAGALFLMVTLLSTMDLGPIKGVDALGYFAGLSLLWTSGINLIISLVALLTSDHDDYGFSKEGSKYYY